ncbi:MAG TPA: diacylglycerol kinase family protein [Stellaceae bacterium]
MASRQRRAILIHNEKAGDKRHERATLVELLERAGYSVSYFPCKQCDLGEVLGHPAEIIVSAGGDGTVAQVVREARSDGPPIAVLPLGTANNIATSLGIGGPIADLVGGWPEARARPYYPISASGPWGTRRLTEGIGFGAFEQAMYEIPRKYRVARAREFVRRIVVDAPPENLEIGIGDETIAGRFAVLEITTIPLIGPRLPIAPEADPSDRELDICFVGDNEAEREGFARWLNDPDSADAVPVSMRRAQRLTVAGQFRRIRLDSKLWDGEPDPRAANSWPVIGIATEPQPLHFLVPD